MNTVYLDSPLGRLRLTAQNGRLSRVDLLHAPEEQQPMPDAVMEAAACQLKEYFAGARRVFELPLAPQGTAFQQAVWQALACVPYGTVVTYAQLAAVIGQASACRAVANAVGKNPLLILLPCHRVVAGNGIGGFSAGLDVKRWLLHLEQIDFAENTRFPEKYFFTFD